MLMTHVANDSRVSLQTVRHAYDTWLHEVDMKKQEDTWLEERYQRNIAAPRSARQEAYDNYLATKSILWSKLQAATTLQQKRQVLSEITKLHIPEILHEGVDTCTIYTKNVQLL